MTKTHLTLIAIAGIAITVWNHIPPALGFIFGIGYLTTTIALLTRARKKEKE